VKNFLIQFNKGYPNHKQDLISKLLQYATLKSYLPTIVMQTYFS